MRAWLIAILAGAVSGVLMVAAMPKGEMAALAILVPIPVLAATRGGGFLKGFLSGLAATFTGAFVAESGVLYRHMLLTEASAWLYTGFGLYGFALSITTAVWAESALKDRPGWWFAALATLLEAALMVEIPAHLSLSQYRNPLAMHLASLGGIWLVSFVLWWASFKIVTLEPRQILGWGSASVACLWLSAFVPFAPLPASPSLRVGCLQIDTIDELALRNGHLEASKVADLVVWPEFGGIPFASGGDPVELRALTTKVGSKPLVTSFPDAAQPLPYNVASLFVGGEESARYQKRKLFAGEKKMHLAGNAAVAVPFGRGKIGLNICFDSCYPHIIRETARLGPEVGLIALPTIDPPSRHHFTAGMHAAYTTFRAAESGIVIARADGFAYSMIVAPNGKIIAQKPPSQGILVAEVSIARRRTLFLAIGNAVLWACGGLVVGGVFARPRARSGRAAEARTSN